MLWAITDVDSYLKMRILLEYSERSAAESFFREPNRHYPTLNTP